MNKYDYLDEITPYKKKSTTKPPKKAKHKHLCEPCVISYPRDWHQKQHLRGGERKLAIDSYCHTCGKIMGLKDRERWYKHEVLKGFSYCSVETEECLRELNPETRTIPLFEIDDPFAKFVPLEESEGALDE
jgi:hypothetical protein